MSMKYIDLAAAKALIRERGVLGGGYSGSEREEDVCEMLEEVRGVELPCKVGDVLYRVFPGFPSAGIIQVTVERIVLSEYEGEITANGNRTYYFSDVGKILFKTREEAERSLIGEMK